MHLHTGLAVRERGFACEQHRPGHRARGIAVTVAIHMHAGRVDGCARDLRAREHVGAYVLHGLERTDCATELPAFLGVGDGEIGLGRRDAHEHCGCERRRFETDQRCSFGLRDLLALRKRRDAR